MSKVNLFWPVYKNLEKEVIKLTDCIHFTDDQLDVYSMNIADLIIRCAIEIESLSKVLYCELGGDISDPHGKARDLYFDTDCIELLENKWKICKKQVMVSAVNFYFEIEANKILLPLHKANRRGTSGSKWKQAYQAIKHDRINSLKWANIGILLHSLAGLFILNLYYKDEIIDLGRVYMSDHSFDNRAGSEIFSVFCYKATGLHMSPYMDDRCIVSMPDNDLDKSVYIIKYDDISFRNMHENYLIDTKNTYFNFNNSVEIANFLEEHPEYNGKDFTEICLASGGIDLLTKIVSSGPALNKKDTRTEAILNKHNGIYPFVYPKVNQEET